ncbi:hypothetical protein BKA62DRAFT_774673 [Auriculariales sp. MPI-PUGE-AT-0066]|nr:hypothetical protein BKA62DRAFT_774673 [Auriculariales sp. MPI-PUGE-AT-0066]
MTNSVTNIIKVLVGRPRPDMLDRCKPIADMKRLNEGFRSFPSGHSSLSATGMTVLALFLAAKLTLYPSIGSGVKAWLCVVRLYPPRSSPSRAPWTTGTTRRTSYLAPS